MESLWKASKIYGVPLTDPILKDLNEYDVVLMEWLTRFENPKFKEEYTRKFVDEDFIDFWENPDAKINPLEDIYEVIDDVWEEVT